MPKAETRFTDNTSFKTIDRRRILGFSGGMPYMLISPLGSNQPREEIGQGQLIVFKPHVENAFDGDFEYSPVENPPSNYARSLEMNFGIEAENDWGYRTLRFLTNLDYDKSTGWDEADEYFDVVHPKFSQIGRTCEMGLEVLVFDDNDDVPRPCPKCRLEYLASSDCKQRMAASELDKDILQPLHEALTLCYTKSLAFAEKKLEESKSEIEKARNGQPSMKLAFTDVDHYFQKMLHRKEYHIEQAELMAKQSANQGMAIAEGLRQGGGFNADPTQGMSNAEKAEFYQWKAEKEAKAAKSVKFPSTDQTTWAEVATTQDFGGVGISVKAEVAPESEPADDAPIAVGETVKYDGADAIIVSKHFGKYKLDVGSEKTVMAHRNEISQ